MRSLRLLAGAALLAGIGTSLPAQRHVWIVDPTGGPGTNFTAVQAAADAAQPGDLLRLRSSGQLGSLTTGKPLLLLTDPGQMPVLGFMELHGLPAGATFVLAGVTLGSGSSPGGRPAIRLSACLGQVVLQDLHVVDSGCPSDPDFAIDASDCRSVDVKRFTTRSSRGLLALRSSVTLANCWFSIDDSEKWPNCGHSAIDARQSDLSLVDTVARGGPGMLRGGNAMRVVDGIVRVGGTPAVGSSLQPGAGSSPPAVALQRGTFIFDPVTTTIVRGIATTTGEIRSEPVPVMHGEGTPGGLAIATLTAPAGVPALLAFGVPLPPTTTGLGSHRLDLSAGTCALAIGATSRAGTLSTSKQVPNDPGLLGIVFAAQGAAWTSAGPRLTNGALLVLR